MDFIMARRKQTAPLPKAAGRRVRLSKSGTKPPRESPAMIVIIRLPADRRFYWPPLHKPLPTQETLADLLQYEYSSH